jgi:hypothetical protein
MKKLNITLYKYAGSSKVVNKSVDLTELKKISGVKIWSAEGVNNMNFRLKFSPEVYKANYLHCAETGRYYFINNIIMESGKILVLECHTDVLYSDKEGIYNSPAWVSNSSAEPDIGQKMLNTPYIIQQDEIFESWEFASNVFTKDTTNISNTVLITI